MSSPSIKNTTNAVQAIFSFHVVTASLAFISLVAAGLLFFRQFQKGVARPRFMRKTLGDVPQNHSSMGTHLFLMAGLFNLMVAYATQAAIVALQVKVDSPVDINSSFAYQYHLANPVNSFGTSQGRNISILSFLYHMASILTNFSIIGAIWLHANYMEERSTGMKAPGFISWIWNLFWLAVVLSLGIASWASGIERRGSGNTAWAFPYFVDTDFIVRSLYVSYIAIVITASTSATIEAVLCWMGVKKNGFASELFAKSTLTRFVFLVVPIIWARNAFSIAEAIIIYKNPASWSETTNQAMAFLFIIFGELSQLAILLVILYGAWTYGNNINRTTSTINEARDSESYYPEKDLRVA